MGDVPEQGQTPCLNDFSECRLIVSTLYSTTSLDTKWYHLIPRSIRKQLANPGSPGKMAVKTECVCVYVSIRRLHWWRAMIYESYVCIPLVIV